MMTTGLGRPVSSSERPSAILFSLTKMLSVAGNTFTESIRQPAFAIILGASITMIIVSPYITMFTLQQTPKFVTDMGLATIMLAGLLLAAFTASNVISQEIENRTVLTVISKPIGRSEFIFGKFLGVMAGLTVAIYLLSLALVLTVSGGALEADIEQELSFVVAGAIFGSMFLAVCYGIYSNFFHDKPFPSRSLGAAIPLFTLCFIVLAHYDSRALENNWGVFGKGVDLQVIYGTLMVLWSVLLIASVAIAASTRLTTVVNITVCSGFFLLGLLSDYLFLTLGKGSKLAEAAYKIVPNLQFFWISDFVTAGAAVPVTFVIDAAVYAALYIVSFLFLAMILFRTRQVA